MANIILQRRLPGSSLDMLCSIVNLVTCFTIGENDRLVNVTYKQHALLHLAFGSEYESPRLGGCWMGEDYMRLTRVLISSCMKGTRLEDVSRKSAAKFLRAMDFTNRDDEETKKVASEKAENAV